MFLCCNAHAPRPLQGGEGYSQLKPIQRVFALMPLMHSEALADQEVGWFGAPLCPRAPLPREPVHCMRKTGKAAIPCGRSRLPHSPAHLPHAPGRPPYLQACVAGFERLQHECAAGGWGDMIAMSAENIKYAQAHRDVVARWGRFPHRNAILGRPSTPEEAEGIAAGTIPKW